MSQITDLAKTSTKAGFNYLWGLVISTVISSLGTLYIADMLGSTAYGIYGVALTVPNMLMLFRDWGINQAMIRYTAQYRAENRETKIRSIFITGIAFEIAIGLILTLFSIFMSNYFAGFLIQDGTSVSELALLIQIASIAILANGLVAAATAVFTGTEKTTYYSIMLICQSVFKTMLIIGLIMAGFGTTGAMTGFTLSCIIAGLVGFLFTIQLYRKIPQPPTPNKLELKEHLKMMIKYSTPLGILTIITGFLAQFYVMFISSSYVSPFSDFTLLGNYFFATNFIVLITFFQLPITNMLFPAFSKLNIKTDKTALKNAFQSSVKYSTLIVAPVTAIVMCLSTPAITTLSPKYPSAPLFLTLLAIPYLFCAAGSLSVGNIINSQGKTSLNLKFAILTAAIGLPMGIFLMIHYGIFGLIFTSIVSPIPSTILSLIWVKKHYDLTIAWISSAKILLSTAITALLTYIIVNYIPHLHTTPLFTNTIYPHLSNFISETAFTSAIQLVIGTTLFIITFIGFIILTKTLSIQDINNLRNMTTNIGPITKIVHTILNIIEKIMKKLKLT